MDYIVVGLILLGVMVLAFPKKEEDEEIQEFTSRDHCEIHQWETKDSGVGDSKYTECSVCHFLPGSGNYNR